MGTAPIPCNLRLDGITGASVALGMLLAFGGRKLLATQVGAGVRGADDITAEMPLAERDAVSIVGEEETAGAGGCRWVRSPCDDMSRRQTGNWS